MEKENKSTLHDKKNIIEFLSFIYISFFLAIMLILVIQTIYQSISLRDYSTFIYVSGGIGLLLYFASKIKNFKFNKYEIMVFIMIVLSCLSLLNAVDINVAIFGRENRYEGLLVWLSYYIFILVAMNIKNKRYLYVIIFLISIHMISNIYYGLYQVKVFSMPTLFYVSAPEKYATGFLGNSNFFSSLSTIFYGLILGLFLKIRFGCKKYFLAILLLLANLGVLMCGAMSAFVTIIIINLVCFIQMIALIVKKKNDYLIYCSSLIIGILSFVLVFLSYTNFYPSIKNDILVLFGQTKDVIVESKMDDNYGSGRIFIWKNTIEKIKEAPITGYGIDNFAHAFNNNLFLGKRLVDKAHNDYLQKALCEGIISGLVFVVFLLTIFFKRVFKNLSPIYYGLLLAFTGYSIQAFFNVSFINVAPIYFIIIGLLVGDLDEKMSLKNKEELSEKYC